MTKLTNEERKAVIEQFHARIAEGLTVDDAWRRKMMVEAPPKLPDDATAAQLDAWVELTELVADPSFVESLRTSTRQIQEKSIDMDRLRIANEEVAAAAGTLRARDVAPSSEQAGAIVHRYVEAVAGASGKAADEAFYRMFCERFAAHDPRPARYRELLAIMKGEPPSTGTSEDWRYIADAITHHLH